MNFAKYVKLRREKFGAVVFDTLKEKVYVTNEPGDEILRLIADGAEVEEIVNSLAGRYDRDRSEIESDVVEFVDGLRSAGLLAAAGVGQE